REQGLAAAGDLTAIGAAIDQELAEAADEALKAPRPPKSSAAMWVYSPDVDPTSIAFDTPARSEGKPDTMVGLINRTLKDEMARQARIVTLGADPADASSRDA